MSHNHYEHINEVMNRDIAETIPVATMNELKSKTNVNEQTAYIIADAFTGNPYQLLGQVVEIRQSNTAHMVSHVNGRDLNFEFSVFPLTGFKVDEQTKLSKPELRGSIIVDKELCMQTAFLNFLSAQLDQKSTFSLVIMDQAKGIVDFSDSSWRTAVTTWELQNPDKMNDPDICYIYVVTGFVQKNIIKKKYRQFDTGIKGGGYGININGKLSTSSDEYSLDIIFGLTPAIIKRPVLLTNMKNRAITDTAYEASLEELKLFASISGAKIKYKYNNPYL